MSCQSPGNADPLFLPAGQLPRSALQVIERQLHQGHEFLGTFQHQLTAKIKIKLDRPPHNVQQAVAWIDRHIRDLVDQLDTSFEFLVTRLKGRRQGFALEQDLATAGGQQSCDNPSQSGLAGSGFADNSDGFTTPNIERDPFDHMEVTVISVAGLDRQHGLGRHRGLRRPFTGGRSAHSDQTGGVILPGMVQDLVGEPLFDFLAVTQHFDPVGHLGHHREVMGDVERRRAVFANQRLEQNQHLDLCGDIECGSRLI